ncbi:MAG: Ig-like domain-containing protein [Anaerolineae bacterium]
MRRLSVFVLFMLGLLAITLPQLMAQQQDEETPSTVTDGVLQWVDSDPLTGAELGLDTPIDLFFDRPLDCDTVTDAFSITPTITGEISCQDTRLRFTPDSAYELSNTYRVTISTTLLGRDGAQLLETLTLDFDTIGFLQVSETFPAPDALDTELDASITVIFNRPIVPLILAEDDRELVNPLQIEPSISGEGRWVNSSIYLFEPDTALQTSTSYTVTIPEGLTAEDGAPLPDDYRFTFTTQPAQLNEFTPAQGDELVALDSAVQMRFNVPVEQTSVEQNFSLQAENGAVVSGTFDWAEDSIGVQFVPDQPLQIATTYTVTVEMNAVSGINGGQATSDQTLTWSFDTVPFPAVQRTSPDDGEDVPPYGGFIVYFASPMEQDQFAEYITIEPEPDFEPNYYWREWDNSLEVSFTPYASTDYSVTIEAGLQDIYGNSIEQPYSFSYSTRPFNPSVQLRVPGPVGFYNADRDPTALFVTHVNVDSFDVTLYDLALADLGGYLLSDNAYEYFNRNGTLSDATRRESWTVDGSQVPENAIRYDLLAFNQSVGALSCPASLPTRLYEQERAIVSSPEDPVRARSAPVDGEIVDLLYQDYALLILGEPICGSDGLLWYPVQLRDETPVWVAESVDDEYLIAPVGDAQITPLPVADSDGNRLAPGAYVLRVNLDQPGNNFYDDTHVMLVANANIILKHTVDSMMVWVTDVQTGAPLANVPVTFFGDDNAFVEIASGITDEEGVLQVDVPVIDNDYNPRIAVVQTDTHFGVGYTMWDQGISPYQFQQNYNYYPDQYRIYLYADRAVYRPGQMVYLRGVVREQDDIRYTVPDADTIALTINNSFGEAIYEGDVTINEYGSFSLELDLADDTSLGFHNVIAEMPSSRNRYYNPSGFTQFNVAEYRLPEFLVDVTPNTPEVVQGDTLSVTVNSTYFFGGNVSDATVDYNVIAENYFFTYQGSGRYDFTDYNYDAGPSAFYASSDRGTIASGSDVTDEQGQFVIEIPARLADVSQSQTYIIEATVRDETGQAVSGRGQVIVHQGELYLGAQPESYVTRAGDESAVNIIAVDWDSNAIADQTVDVRVVERRWSSVQERDEIGRTVWTWSVEEIPVTEGQVTTDEDGQAQYRFVPENGGNYKIYVTTRDVQGNQVRSATYVWVSSDRYVSWRQQNSNRIELIADADSYEIGDTAEILITSPFQGEAEAFITVERGDVITYDRITLTSNSYLYSLPITEAYAPNVFVSVMIVKGVDDNNPVAGFRMGYVQFSVTPERYQLTLDIQSDVDSTSPQQTVTYTITTTDWQGDPVSAEVGVAVTDLASLSLADDPSRPIFNYFYSDQSLSVSTTTPLTINTDQITQEVLDTIKGGGGGLSAEGVIEVRGEFIDTPYWNPHLVTDENGQVSFDVRLPDNLTTWRLNARALTLAPDGVMLVGQDTFDLLSTKPILIRPTTPRFFIVGDEVVLGAVVNNNTENTQDVVVTLNAEGVSLLDDNRTQQISVPANGRTRVSWRVRVTDAEQARLSFLADAGTFSDGAVSSVSLDDEGTLPIYRYVSPEVASTVGTSGVLETAESRVETIYLPARFNIEAGTLTVQVDPSLASSALDSLDYLENYNYQSTHTTVDRLLPNIMTYRAFAEFNLADDALEANLTRTANRAVQKLTAEQHADGGWGWWVNSPSDPMTTAYALLGLYEAQSQGFTVPEQALQRAQTYLQSNLIAINENTSTWQSNRQAFVLYVLARTGSADVARTEVVYRNRDNLSLYAHALLAEAFAYIDPLDTTRSDVLLTTLVDHASISASGVHWQEDTVDYWNWNTDTRTTALALNAFVQLRPESDLIPGIVRYLMIQRRADHWETTQETAWSVMALTNWMIASDELQADYAYEIALNGEIRLSDDVTPADVNESAQLVIDIAELMQGTANQLLINRTGSNDGNLYYTAYLNAQLPIAELQPISNGVTISRSYSLQADADQAPITQAQVGEIVEVRLTIIVPDDMHFVEIYDPLPAGAEGIDPNLNTNAQIGTRPSINRTNPLRYGWGWWWFTNTEFRDEAVVLNADYLPAGTYEYVYAMRAGIEGTYNVIPPAVREVYFPDVYGRGAGSTFIIEADQ